MRKRLFVLAAVIAVLMTLQSCEIPSAVEIRGSPDVSMPVNPGTAGVNDLVTDTLTETDFGGNGDAKISVLNYTNYPELQAFLLHMNYPIDTGVDYSELETELNKVKDFKFDVDTTELSQSIEITPVGDIDEDDFGMEPVVVDLKPVFDEVRDTIQGTMQNTPFEFWLPIVGKTLWTSFFPEGGVDPSELVDMGFGGFVPAGPSADDSLTDFGSLTIGAGTLKITITLAEESRLPGVEITLDELKIGSNPAFDQAFTLSSSSYVVAHELDLTNITISEKLEIRIGKYIDNSTDSNKGALVKLDIKMETFPDDTVKKIQFREISGLEINPEQDLSSLELDNINDINLNLSVGGFLHAELATGTLKLDLDMPEAGAEGVNSLGGITPAFENVKLMQAHSAPDNDGTIWPGINASNDLVDPDDPYDPVPWTFNGDLSGKHLNTKPIEIGGGKINLVENSDNDIKISVYLKSSPYKEEIAVGFRPKIEDISFKAVHVDMDALLEEVTQEKPKIDIPAQRLDDVAEYVKSITFNRIGPKLKFGQVDIGNLEIMIHEPNLGINPGKTYSPITSNGTIDLIATNPEPIIIKNDSGDVLIPELKIEVDIRPIHPRPSNLGNPESGHVIELLNFSTATTEIKMEIDDEGTEVACDWSKVIVDLSSVSGGTGNVYPEPADPAIDLSEIGENLKNFRFDDGDGGIQAWLYARGPDTLFNLKPELTLNAEYTGSPVGGINLLEPGIKLVKSEVLNLPETGEYEGVVPLELNSEVIPSIPINRFATILNDSPSDLRLRYGMNDLIITPGMLENINFEGDIVLDIVVLLPMRLTAGPDAKVVIPKSEEDNPDLLGRDKPDEDTFDWIKSMNLRVTLSDSLFEGEGAAAGGYFYLDDDRTASEEPEIKVPITGNTIQIIISSEDLKYINGKWPYEPEMGVSFNEGTTLALKRGTGIAKVEVSADISYKIDLKNNNRVAGGK